MTEFSFQLYSARNFPPLADTLALLARLGYTQTEGYGGVYDDPAGLRAMLDAHGLTIPSGHFALDMLEDDWSEALTIARALGMTTLICPFLAPHQRPTLAHDWSRLGARLEALVGRARDESLAFAWHNHDFEFAATEDGAIPMQVLLEAAPSLSWEIDVAWVARGGADPFDWIEAWGERIIAAHVKDIAPQGENAEEDGWADVGHGTLAWPEILQSLRTHTQARLFVMEHDNPADLERFASRSIATATSL